MVKYIIFPFKVFARALKAFGCSDERVGAVEKEYKPCQKIPRIIPAGKVGGGRLFTKPDPDAVRLNPNEYRKRSNPVTVNN